MILFFPDGFLGILRGRSRGHERMPAPDARGRGPDQALRRPGRGQGPELFDPAGRDPGPDRPERLGQVDGDEGDHGRRARRAPARSGSTASSSPACRRTRSPASASASSSSTRGRCNGRRCSRTSRSRLLPDKLTQSFAGGRCRRQGACHCRARRPRRTCIDRRPPTLAFADLRRLELAKAIARHPEAGDGRRALRRPHRVGGRRPSPS